MKQTTIIALVVGLALGAIATYGLMEPELQVLRSRLPQNWVPVACAYVDIPPNSRVSRDMLDFRMVPEEVLVRDAVRELQKVEGRTTTRMLRAGDQFRSTDLAPQ